MLVTPGELLEVARGLRALGVAGFSFRGCEVTFYEPLPLELQQIETKQRATEFEETDDEEEETPDKKLERLRKMQADADLYGASH